MKRYPQYKASGIDWIDEIPAHWSVKRFKEFAYTIKGKGADYLDEPTPETDIVLTLDALRQEQPSFYNYAIVTDSDQHCTADDLVVIWDGAGVGEFLKAKKGVLSSTIAKISIDESIVLKDYLWQWRYMIEYRLKKIPTGMGIPHLNPTLLNHFLLVVPPLEEQRAIANYLDEKCGEIDEQIELLEKKLKANERLKKCLINDAVTHGLNTDVTMRPSGIDWIGDIPAHWERLRLKDVSVMYSGLTGKSGDDFRCDDDTKTKPFVPFTNVLNNTKIDFDQFNRVVMTDDEQQNRVQENDLIFLMSSEDYESIAKSAVVVGDPGEVYLNSFCRGLHFTSNIIYAPFVNYQLNSEKYHDALRFEARGFTRINIKVDRVFSQFITVPPLAEQHTIADYLDEKCGEIDASIDNIGKQIDAYKRLKKSLINEVITGRRAV